MSSNEETDGADQDVSLPVKSQVPETSSNQNPSFVNLPDEILLKIFRYLNPYFLSETLTFVCKRFARVLNDEAQWKQMLTRAIARNVKTKSFNIRHPANMGLNETRWWSRRDLLWRHLAVQFSKLEYQWMINADEIVRQQFNQPHYAAIDAVKIIGDGNTVISAGRDRLINVWNINIDNLHLESILSVEKCHDGWIWDIDSCSPETFYTCGWDSRVIYWTVSDNLNKLSSFNCGKPVMAISCIRGLVAAGLSTPKIVLIDPRIGIAHQVPSPTIKIFDLHRHSITDVQLVPQKNLLLSISEDKTLLFFDLRHQKACKRMVRISRENSFPRSLSVYKDLIYIGDSRGNIHFHSLENEKLLLEPINIGTDTRLVSAVIPNLAGITVGSTDGFLRILYPSKPPIFLWEEQVPGEVTCVDQSKHILVAASAANNLLVFRPKQL